MTTWQPCGHMMVDSFEPGRQVYEVCMWRSDDGAIHRTDTTYTDLTKETKYSVTWRPQEQFDTEQEAREAYERYLKEDE